PCRCRQVPGPGSARTPDGSTPARPRPAAAGCGHAGSGSGSWQASGDVGLGVRLHFVARRARVEVAAGGAGAQLLAAVEGLEHAEEVLLDVLEVEEFLVQPGVALH